MRENREAYRAEWVAKFALDFFDIRTQLNSLNPKCAGYEELKQTLQRLYEERIPENVRQCIGAEEILMNR